MALSTPLSRNAKPKKLLYIADHRYRIHTGEGGNVHIKAMIQAFSEFALVQEPPAPVSLGLLRRASKNGRPKGAMKLVEGAALAISLIEKVAAYVAMRPDLVYVRHEIPDVPTLAVLKLLGARIVLEVNALATDESAIAGRTLLWRIRQAIELSAFRFADHVCGISGYLCRQLEGVGAPKQKLFVTHNGVHLADFPESRLSPPRPDGMTIGFIGTGHRWHGLQALVEAFSETLKAHPEARLLMVGPGSAEVERQIEALGLAGKVEITGQLPREEAIATFERRVDIAVQANCLPHGSPLKMFEYMAMRKAIVAARTPAISEILEEGRSGLLVEPNSVPELAAAFGRLLGDPRLRERLAQGARDRVVATFTWRGNAVAVLRRAAPELLGE